MDLDVKESGTISIHQVPTEILTQIFSYVRVNDISSVCLVCKEWNKVMDTESLWKFRCHQLTERVKFVQEDRISGHTWKETFKMNYGRDAVKRLWKKGFFSNPASYDDLPQGMFTHLDADSWAEIFQLELDRA